MKGLTLFCLLAVTVPGQTPDPLPPLALPTLKGGTVKSEQLARNVVVLDFWATWCEPCIGEIPLFNRLQEKYAARGVKVIGLAVQSGWARDIKRFAARHQMRYAILAGNDDVVADFGVIAFPTAYLIAPGWKAYKKYSGTYPEKAAELERDIETLLKDQQGPTRNPVERSNAMPLSQCSRRSLVAALGALLLLGGRGEAADRQDRLKPEERKVVDYLLNDWGKDYSVTSVDIAMAAVGVKQSDETRFRIGSYIKAHPELHEVIRRWGWVTLVLTAEEKLMARALINAERDSKPVPTVAEIAKAVAIKEDQVKRGLAVLERYEIIQRDPSRAGAGYKVVPRYIKWEPRLDFLFHTVTLGSGRRFNTN